MRAAWLAALAIAALPPAATAEEITFAGKTISIYIGFGAGGSYDGYAHLLARHIGKYLPGTPTVVAQSMPGAGSFKLASWLMSVAPRDGTAFGIISQSAALEEALGSPGVAYKSADFNWLGRTTASIEAMMTFERPGATPATSIEDARSREIMIAGTGPGSPSQGYPKLLNQTAGTKFRIIPGYPGSSDALLALERGEVDAAFTSWGSLLGFRSDWVTNKRVNLLMQGTVQRSQALPAVPAAPELGLTDDDKAVLTLYASTAEVGRAFVAPPGIPSDRVAILRTAFMKAVQDLDFQAEAEKSKLDYSPLDGEALQKIIVQTSTASPKIVSRMKSILQAE
jgi:tripartite-type tricarboxylate transporter receptor subunit TctC